MKSLSYEELINFIQKELATPNNERLITCFSKQNKDERHTFIIAEDDISITRPWQGEPHIISKGDYIHADISDIYGIEKFIFSRCFIPLSAN